MGKAVDCIEDVLQRLTHEFVSSAKAGTPGLIGASKENPARYRLGGMLPNFVSVGSGLIMDSYDNISKQQDVVIYEKDISPVFMINETPEATYYPCEGVVGVGEVKSTLGTRELEDAFEKIASVKRLKRRLIPSSVLNLEESVAFRKYGSITGFSGTKVEELNPEEKGLDQIFGFILCKDFGLNSDTLVKKAADLWKSYPKEVAPNLIVSMESGFVTCINSKGFLDLSPMDIAEVAHGKVSKDGFTRLIECLNIYIRDGRTTETNVFDYYYGVKGKRYNLGHRSAIS